MFVLLLVDHEIIAVREKDSWRILSNMGGGMAATEEVTEAAIQDFWNTHPCGDHQVEGLKGDYEAFFCRYDELRYRREEHIPGRLDAIDWKRKRVLEIGLGQRSESEQIIRRGAMWSGVDLTRESIARVCMRLRLRELPYERLECGSALALPFPH
jgi:hypothetical protein